MNSVELRDKKAGLKKEAFEILDRCKAEIRDLTPDEADKINNITDNIKIHL